MKALEGFDWVTHSDLERYWEGRGFPSGRPPKEPRRKNSKVRSDKGGSHTKDGWLRMEGHSLEDMRKAAIVETQRLPESPDEEFRDLAAKLKEGMSMREYLQSRVDARRDREKAKAEIGAFQAALAFLESPSREMLDGLAKRLSVDKRGFKRVYARVGDMRVKAYMMCAKMNIDRTWTGLALVNLGHGFKPVLIGRPYKGWTWKLTEDTVEDLHSLAEGMVAIAENWEALAEGKMKDLLYAMSRRDE